MSKGDDVGYKNFLEAQEVERVRVRGLLRGLIDATEEEAHEV